MASVDKAADLSGEVPFHILSETPTVLPAVSCGFCKFPQANARIIFTEYYTPTNAQIIYYILV